MYRPALYTFSLIIILTQAPAAEEVINERIEWSDVWVVGADADTLPRVLLVGDSIAKGYYNGVEKALDGKANCARFATSKFLAHPDYLTELGLLVDRFKFDVIHINNGLHGWGYTEAQYREGLDALFAWLKDHAPDAKIIWCMSTPVRDGQDLSRFVDDKNERVKARNTVAAELAKEAEVPVNDLYAQAVDHPEYFSPDGVHFNDDGRALQSNQVAEVIQAHLPAAAGGGAQGR